MHCYEVNISLWLEKGAGRVDELDSVLESEEEGIYVSGHAKFASDLVEGELVIIGEGYEHNCFMNILLGEGVDVSKDSPHELALVVLAYVDHLQECL